MEKQEQSFLQTQAKKPLTWARFIDYIFMIWEGTELELTNFLSKLNDFGKIKHTWSYLQTHATFLDVDLNVDINGKLQTF
jgi:hypothetical protein